jgi:hypothetical protein
MVLILAAGDKCRWKFPVTKCRDSNRAEQISSSLLNGPSLWLSYLAGWSYKSTNNLPAMSIRRNLTSDAQKNVRERRRSQVDIRS